MFPWQAGLQMMRFGIAAMEHGARMAETFTASGEVIAARTRIMADAIRDPMNGDYAELSRMVPEKVAALSLSATAFGAESWRIQQQMMAAMRDTATMMMGATPAGMIAYQGRNARRGARTMAMGRSALTPVHRTVTANARRLKGR